MTRQQLEHIIRAAGSIVDENAILVLGSQAILGSVADPPPELLVSMEADVCPMSNHEKADLISGSIGEISHFQDTFGYYAHGLPPEACALPEGWESRLHRVQSENTRGIVGLCLDPIDLACAKLVAGREKDIGYVAAMLRHGLIGRENVKRRMSQLGKPSDLEAAQRNWVAIIRLAG